MNRKQLDCVEMKRKAQKRFDCVGMQHAGGRRISSRLVCDTKISVEELNRRLDQTARDLKQFMSEPDRGTRAPVFRDGDHVSVRILPIKGNDE